MTKLRAILKRRWLILVLFLLLGAGAGMLSPQVTEKDQQQVWTARQVVVANSGTGLSLAVSQDALKVTRGEVPQIAAKALQFEGNPDTLASQVTAVFDSKTNSIVVSSNDSDKDAASSRVQAFIDAFLESTNRSLQAGEQAQVDSLKADLEATRAQLVEFDAKYPELTQVGFTVGPNDVYYVNLLTQRATIVSRIESAENDVKARELQLVRQVPYQSLGVETPKPAESGLIDVPASRTARAALVGFIGLLLGSGLVMLIERIARRIDTREELVEITDLPVLAEIGYVPSKRRAVDPAGRVTLSGVWAEPYRRVRSAIQFVQANAVASGGWTPQPGSPSHVLSTPPSVFLVTSTSPAEGKSTTSALVALALAEVGVPTLLIGGDFRKPQLDRLVGAAQSPSLQDLATLDLERPTIDEVVQSTDFDNLYVAAAGHATREVAGLVEAAKIVSHEAVARGATVIIDSSPLQAANDTLDLLPSVDYVIIVLRVGKSSEGDLLDTIATLRRMETHLLGIVLIGTPAGRKQEYYYDYYSSPPTVTA